MKRDDRDILVIVDVQNDFRPGRENDHRKPTRSMVYLKERRFPRIIGQ
jgi:nicotinamidase-related amidase